MPKSKNRTPRRPKASARSNSWFRMQASADNEADIYIYDEIGYWGVTARQFVNDLKALGDITHINLHINSPGGDVFDGIAIFNALKHHGAAITVHIDGLAASMASVIAMVGNPVIMPENTMMMVHKPWGGTVGNADDLRESADFLDRNEAMLLSIYAKKTGKSISDLFKEEPVTPTQDLKEEMARAADDLKESLQHEEGESADHDMNFENTFGG